MPPTLPETRHIRIGYLGETLGEIILGHTDDQPQFHGAHAAGASGASGASAIKALYESVAQQPLYRDLTPPQILARMTQRLRGPTWAVALDSEGQPTRL